LEQNVEIAYKPFFQKETFTKETSLFFLLAQVFFFRKKEKVL